MKTYANIHHRIRVLAIAALLPVAAGAQSLQSSTGVHIVVSGSPSIVLQDAALISNGELAPGKSNIIFAGNTASPARIGGSMPLSFYSITLQKQQGGLLLDNDISVSGTLKMDQGNLELNNHNINLGTTGSIAGERNDARITGALGGTVRAIALLNAPQTVNPGNIGVAISSNDYLGLTTIIRGHVAQNNAGTETGIRRYFDIQPTAGAHVHASLRFYYFDAELNGQDKNALSVFATANGQHGWQLAGRDNTDGIAGWVAKNDVSQLSRFTLAIPGTSTTATLSKLSAHAWPNPARDGFTLSMSGALDKDLVVGLYDQQGRLLESRTLHGSNGENQLHWDISRYAAANYFLRFSEKSLKGIAILKQ